MNLNEFKHMWQEEKDDWVLVNTKHGYAVVNKRSQIALLVSDDETEDAIIKQMLKEGNKVYDKITDAYSDI